MTKRYLASLFALMLLIGPAACQRATYHYQPLPAAASADSASEATPQLLFLSFRMSTDADGKHRVEPLMMKAVPGQTNAIAEDEEVTGTSYIIISQLDAANQPCGPARRVPHPLLQDVEAPGEPGTGVMQRHLVALSQAEFFVRLARLPRAHAVRLEEAGPAAPHPISITFPLPN
jgi:hypothetical protein